MMRRELMRVVIAVCAATAPAGCGVVGHWQGSRQARSAEMRRDSTAVRHLAQSGAESVTIGTEGSRETVDEEVWMWEAVYDTAEGERGRGAVVREKVSVIRRAAERMSESRELRAERQIAVADDREVDVRVADVDRESGEVMDAGKKRGVLRLVLIGLAVLMATVVYQKKNRRR
jgi:hypothetical protein